MLTTKNLNKKVRCIIAHNGYNIGDIIIATETMIQFHSKSWEFFKPEKTFKIKTRYIVGRGNQANRENIVEGSLDYLNKYFAYTLEIGNSWNPKINRYSKTINAFVKNLQKSYEEKESACYNRTYVELLTSNN